MTIGAIFFINLKGDIVISRYYRNDISRHTADEFRVQVVTGNPSEIPHQDQVIHLIYIPVLMIFMYYV